MVRPSARHISSSPTHPPPTRRRLRRTSLRYPQSSVNDLAKRRAQFERLAQQHIDDLRSRPHRARLSISPLHTHSTATAAAADDNDDGGADGNDDPIGETEAKQPGASASSAREAPSASPDTSQPTSTSLRASPATSPPASSASTPAHLDAAAVADVTSRLIIDDSAAQSRLHTLLRRLKAVRNPAEEQNSSSAYILPSSSDDLHALANALASDRYITYEDDHIRLLAISCVAEVFRICAPDPPMSESVMISVCAVVIDQLAVLAAPADELEAVRFSLLEQLANVKTLVVLCDHDYIVCDLFACFYACVRSHQPAKIRQYFADILVSLLVEGETVNNERLDALLAPLVPALNYSPAAIALAEQVVAGCANHIAVPLCKMMNASVRALRLEPQQQNTNRRHGGRRKSPQKKTAQSNLSDIADLSEHHEHFSELIICINRIAPDILIFVLPNFEDRCRSQHVAVRFGAVDILARLFTTREDMGSAYPSLFTEFLERCNDIDSQIRESVTSSLGDLIMMYPKQVEHLDRMLWTRVHDSEVGVRQAALRSIGKAVDLVSDDTLSRFFSRVQDCDEAVRTEALHQIVSCYTPVSKDVRRNRQQSNVAKFSSDMEMDNESPVSGRVATENDSGTYDPVEKRILRFASVPNTLVTAIVTLRRARQLSSAAAIERALFEKILLPSAKADNEEALRRSLRRAALVISQLSGDIFPSFSSLVMERAHARRALVKISTLRLDGRLSSSGTKATEQVSLESGTASARKTGAQSSATMSKGNIEEARNAAKELSLTFLGTPNEMEVILQNCQALATAVDLKIHNRVIEAVSCSTSTSEANEAVSDAIARLGSRNAVGIFCAEHLFPKCRPGLFSSIHLEQICRLALEIAVQNREKDLVVKSEGKVDENGDNGGDEEGADGGRSEERIVQVSPQILVGIIRFLSLVGPNYPSALVGAVEGITSLVTINLSEKDWSAEVVLTCLRMICCMPRSRLLTFDNESIVRVIDELVFASVPVRLRYCSKLSKAACLLKIHIESCREGESATLMNFVRKLSSNFEDFDGDIASIIGPLSAMAVIAKREPGCFRKVAIKCFDFARVLLFGALNERIRERVAKDEGSDENLKLAQEVWNASSERMLSSLGRGECEFLLREIDSDVHLVIAEVVSRASKLLVYGLHHVDSSEVGGVLSIFMSILQEKEGDVFELREGHSSKEKRGKGEAAESISSTIQRAANRLSIGRAVLYMARQPAFFLAVTPPRVVTTMLVAQDFHPTVRLCFVQCVQRSVVKKRLPMRWVVSMALMAVDPDASNVSEVRKMMTQVFQHRRRLCEFKKQNPKAKELLLPESTTADLLWVLANLPGVEMEQKAGFPETRKCIELFVECLCGSKEYARVLNEYIESVCIAEDATEVEGGGERTERLRELSRIASEVLKKRLAGRKLDLVEHVRDIRLPRDFFRTGLQHQAESTEALRPKLLDVAKKYDARRGFGQPAVVGDSEKKEKNVAESMNGSGGEAGGGSGKKPNQAAAMSRAEKESHSTEKNRNVRKGSGERGRGGRGRKRGSPEVSEKDEGMQNGRSGKGKTTSGRAQVSGQRDKTGKTGMDGSLMSSGSKRRRRGRDGVEDVAEKDSGSASRGGRVGGRSGGERGTGKSGKGQGEPPSGLRRSSRNRSRASNGDAG